MKDSLLLPLRQAIIFLLSLLLTFLMVYLYFFTIEYSKSEPFPDAWFGMRAISSLTVSLSPAILLTVLISYFIVLKYPGNPLLTFLIFFLVVFGLFLGGKTISNQLEMRISPPSVEALPINKILNYQYQTIYITERNGENVTGIVTLNKAEDSPKLSNSKSGYLIAESDLLKTEDDTIILTPPNPSITPFLTFPSFFSNVIRDIQIFKLIVEDSILHMLAVSLFLVALWIISRLSAWPMFNLFLTIGAIRATLAILYYLQTPLLQRILSSVAISDSLLNLFFFGGSAVLLILWDIFFVPYPKPGEMP